MELKNIKNIYYIVVLPDFIKRHLDFKNQQIIHNV